MMPERYARNSGSVDAAGQQKLLASRVMIVGLGGLGGSVLEALVRIGVGQIVGVDPDVFDASNLNRQLLATMETLGESKASAAARRVAAVNPDVKFVGYAAKFESLSADDFSACDIVVDCLDSFPARRELAARCDAAGVMLVHGAIAGWCGQVGLCPPGSGAMDIFSSAGAHGVETETGNLPMTVGVAANMMAAKIVQQILTPAESPQPELVFFDLQSNDWETIKL